MNFNLSGCILVLAFWVSERGDFVIYSSLIGLLRMCHYVSFAAARKFDKCLQETLWIKRNKSSLAVCRIQINDFEYV